MKNVTIFGKENCAYCIRAKMLCDLNDIQYTYIDILYDDEALDFFMEQGFKSVPQVYVDGELVGGFTEFAEYVKDKI